MQMFSSFVVQHFVQHASSRPKQFQLISESNPKSLSKRKTEQLLICTIHGAEDQTLYIVFNLIRYKGFQLKKYIVLN